MRVNILGYFHPLPQEIAKDFVQFNPYLHKRQIYLVKKAIQMINNVSRGNFFCNLAFQTLNEEKRSFDDVFNDDEVWISLVKGGAGTAGLSFKKDIGITEFGFSMAEIRPDPTRHVASIIVHEMAHVNGAGDNPDKAEWLLFPCGFVAEMDYGKGGVTDL
jgi:hypothetical protein